MKFGLYEDYSKCSLVINLVRNRLAEASSTNGLDFVDPKVVSKISRDRSASTRSRVSSTVQSVLSFDRDFDLPNLKDEIAEQCCFCEILIGMQRMGSDHRVGLFLAKLYQGTETAERSIMQAFRETIASEGSKVGFL